MKSRTGFVSNSSTSSFIVKYIERPYKTKSHINKDIGTDKIYLNNRDVKKLEKFGFKKTLKESPYEYGPTAHCAEPEVTTLNNFRGELNFGYWVSVNQDDIIYFLLKNNIPFTASIHYNHAHMIYEKDAKYFYEFANIGLESETYKKCFKSTPEQIKKEYEDKWFRKKSVVKYLKDRKGWH